MSPAWSFDPSWRLMTGGSKCECGVSQLEPSAKLSDTHRTRSCSSCLRWTFPQRSDSPHGKSKFSHYPQSTARSWVSMWFDCFYCNHVYAWVTFYLSTTLWWRRVASQTSHNEFRTFDPQQVLTNCWVCSRKSVLLCAGAGEDGWRRASRRRRWARQEE